VKIFRTVAVVDMTQALTYSACLKRVATLQISIWDVPSLKLAWVTEYDATATLRSFGEEI
jgi:hypothetical protein